MSREFKMAGLGRTVFDALLLPVFLSLVVFAVLDHQSSSSATTDKTSSFRPELVLQTGHTMKVNCAVFGPNGDWLASGGADNKIEIWDILTGRELRVLTGHSGWIKSLAASRKGDWLASGSNDRTVKIWTVSTGEELRALNGHLASIETLSFSPDNRWLASGSSDNTIKIWDPATGAEMHTLKGHAGWVISLAFSGDGRFLASGSADNTIKIWDTAMWKEVRTLRNTEKVTAIVFSPDNHWLASGGSAGTVSLWRLETGRQRFPAKNNRSPIRAISFAAGDLLLSASADGAIASRDLTAGKERQMLSGNSGAGELAFASFNADGTLLAQSVGNRTVDVRSVASVDAARTLESRSTGFYAVAASPDGRWLASGTNDRTVRLWQLATGQEMPRLSGHTGWVSTIAFSPDSRLVASGSISGEVKIWDPINGHEAFSLPTSQGGINVVAFSADGNLLASAGIQATVQLWDLSTKQPRTLAGHSGEITSLAFSPDGRLLAASGTGKTIRLWDLGSGNTTRVLDHLGDQVNALAFSPNGKWLAAGGSDQAVSLWEVATGGLMRTLTGHRGTVRALAFSSDGHLLASGSSDRSVKLWETESGNEAGTLNGASGTISSVTFSNNGHRVVSASEDGRMLVWSTATSGLLATLVSMRDSDDWLVVSPDGLFDGSPGAWNLLLWRFSENLRDVAPVEAFFNEFYYPGFLADVFAGKQPRAKQNISQKDRHQPRLKLTLADGQSADRLVGVRSIPLKIEIADASAGAQDLRLFRNGSLVKVWHGDVMKGQSSAQFETTIPIVVGENHLTAYAFNHDNIKSADVSLAVAGAESLKRPATAYIVAIGVNEYDNSHYNLRYAVADARAFVDELRRQQTSLKQFANVKIISLLDREATKGNILNSLGNLAAQVQPEDAVIVYFAGHGTAQQNRFYLLSHELGYQGPRAKIDQTGLDVILSHSISDLDLEHAFQEIDAGNFLLVLDTCNSGQALEAEEKRRGPMNSKGLAQLAYEKGMYILTATQSYQAAREAARLGHGFLTYALVEEGLKTAAADTQPKDGQVSLREWLDYATRRVPGIQQEALRQTRGLEHPIAFVEGEESINDPSKRSLQQPRVFYRREPERQPLIVAKPAPG
jgi:WD40 repeat protein